MHRSSHLATSLQLADLCVARGSILSTNSNLVPITYPDPPALEWVYEDVEERDNAEPEEKAVSYGKYKFFWD